MRLGHGRGGSSISGATARPARGQALVVLLALTTALVITGFTVYELGQRHIQKRRLINAVDTAAMNAAVWQARALNFDAYTNRAIVANEAFIAQSVSLRSWSQYLDRLLPSVSTSLSWVPYVNTAARSIERLWSSLDRVLQPSLSAFEGAVSWVDHDLAAAQRVMHLSVAQVVPDLVRDSLRVADQRYRLSAGGELTLARWGVDWIRFASFYGGAWRWRPQEVVERSLDGFTAERNQRWRPALGTDLLRLEKRGGTELIQFETWRGLDTLSLHTRRYGFFGSMRERQPISWGAAEAGERTARRGVHGGTYTINPRASRMAERAMRSHRLYLGLPSVYDLSVAQRTEFAPPVLTVRAVASDSGGTWHAQASSSVMFRRPESRTDGAEETPSLFSPFWSARWVSAPLSDRVLMAARDGDPVWTAVATP